MIVLVFVFTIIKWLINWFLLHVTQPSVVLCQEVSELRSLYIHIYIFV